MIRINLLPVRQIKKRIKSRNEVIGLLVGFFLILLLLVAVSYNQSQNIAAVKGNIIRLQQEKDKYTSILKQIKDVERTKKILEQKQNVIKELQVNSQIPVRILDEVTRLTPSSRIWLNSLALKAGTLVISGIALDNETIAQYMLGYMQSTFFTKAELANSSMTDVGGQKLKSFGLTVSLESPAAKSQVIVTK